MKAITVSTTITAPISVVWDCWTQPEHITQWNFASDDWECPAAKNELRTGSKFCFTMAAIDKSFQFDFTGTYTEVLPNKRIAYTMDDGRKATIEFTVKDNTVYIDETFDLEATHSEEQQRFGWQSILNNFKKHVEQHRKNK